MVLVKVVEIVISVNGFGSKGMMSHQGPLNIAKMDEQVLLSRLCSKVRKRGHIWP